MASSVTLKALAAYRVLAAVTARESGTLCQGQVPPVLSGGGRLGRETGAPVTSSYLNCAWIDSPIFYKEPLYLLPVDANAAFPDSDRWQLTALDQLVHARPRHPKVFGGFGDLHPLVTFFVQSQPLFIRWSTIAYKRIPQGVRLENLYKCAVRIIWRDRK